jgi:ATP-dependent exoDNAse (exonuclease V) alpha subunit
LAIYHFTVTVISRARGQRIVAVAAAHAAAKLRDEYYGVLHNHERREGVEFTELAAPAGAPSWVFDREQLWNRVEAAECRKDSQLARAIEVSLPVELDLAQCIDLLRDFVREQFVAKHMIADMSIRRTKLGNPNAHVLLTMREASTTGFGPKVRQWNRKSNLLEWRSSWANVANLHLARAGHPVRIDHRTLDEQQIELEPARRTGIGRPSVEGTLPEHLQARIAEQRRIAHDNGTAILEDPSIAIRALARQRRRFTRADLYRFLKTRTDCKSQQDAALATVIASPELVAFDVGNGGAMLYTSRDLIEAEKALLRRAQNMTKRGDFHAVAVTRAESHDFVQTARKLWNERGNRVREAIPASGEPLAKGDVVLLQGAEMLELKMLEKLMDAAERARATMVLVADAERLQAMGAMSPLHQLMARMDGDARGTRTGPSNPPLVP